MDDSPWDDNPSTIRDAEWSKLSSDFVNAGYREGITAGKEAALQEGFDAGFAQIGAPLGREIGLLRGTASALLSALKMSSVLPQTGTTERDRLTQEARAIVAELGEIRYSDVAPRDLEAEQHAREHLEAEGDDGDLEMNEELKEKRDMEGLEDMMAQMGAGSVSTGDGRRRPTVEDVARLKQRLQALGGELGIRLLL